MRLFDIKKDTLTEVNSTPFKLEKDIQNLVEKNCESIFNCTFIETELTIGKYRLDSLCFDEENNSFVIIEYKKGKSYSVIDQGYTYLQLLLNNKSIIVPELIALKKDNEFSISGKLNSKNLNFKKKDLKNFIDNEFLVLNLKEIIFSSNTNR